MPKVPPPERAHARAAAPIGKLISHGPTSDRPHSATSKAPPSWGGSSRARALLLARAEERLRRVGRLVDALGVEHEVLGGLQTEHQRPLAEELLLDGVHARVAVPGADVTVVVGAEALALRARSVSSRQGIALSPFKIGQGNRKKRPTPEPRAPEHLSGINRQSSN